MKNLVSRIGVGSVAGLVVLCAAVQAEGAALKPKALLIMLDGFRADVMLNGSMPNVDRLREGKWQPGYSCAWSATGQTIVDAPTVSAPNHTAIATCVNAQKTKVFDNGQTQKGLFDQWPTWLMRLARANPSFKAYSVYSWNDGDNYPRHPQITHIRTPEGVHSCDADENNAAAVAKLLAAADGPDAIQYFVNMPDSYGHRTGYYPYGTGYLNSIATCDRYIGGCLKAIASRPTFAEEDWVITLTGDHGGYGRGHGQWGGHASTVPVVITSRHVPQGRIPGVPRHYDLTATVLAHFGQDPVKLNLDGRPVTRVAPQQPARALTDSLVAYLPFNTPTPENAIAGGPVAKAIGPRVVMGDRYSGFAKGCLCLRDAKGPASAVLLEGSDKLPFENGNNFTVTLWVRHGAIEKDMGDPAIFGNKDWSKGVNPGVVLAAGRRAFGAHRPGICFNTGVTGDRVQRIDLGTYDVVPGKWTFYAVTMDAEGTLTFYQGAPDGYLYWLSDRAPDMALHALPFCIGQDGTGHYAKTFNGDIDDFALWTRSLTRDEIRRIFDAGRQGAELGDLLK